MSDPKTNTDCVNCEQLSVWVSMATKAVKTQGQGSAAQVCTQSTVKVTHLCLNLCKFFRYKQVLWEPPHYVVKSHRYTFQLYSVWNYRIQWLFSEICLSSFGCFVFCTCTDQPVCHKIVQTSWKVFDFPITHICVERQTVSGELSCHKSQSGLAKGDPCSIS